MIIWQKSIGNGNMVAIGRSYSELAEVFLDEDVVYNTQMFDERLKTEHESGWYLVGENHAKIIGCLYWLWDKKYITSHEYSVLEGTLI